MVYNEYNYINNIICLCTNNNTLILKLPHHSIKQLSITHAVHSDITIAFNSSMLKKLKLP